MNHFKDLPLTLLKFNETFIVLTSFPRANLKPQREPIHY